MAKKIIGALLLVLVLGGCSAQKETDSNAAAGETTTVENTSSESETEVDIDMTEELYVFWINEIYANPEDYVGQTIRLEGMYMEEVFADTGDLYNYVYRQGPGCCGNDGAICGFEFTYEGVEVKENDWIEVVGELIQYEEDGMNYISLKADTVTVKEERGNEILPQ